MPSEFRQRLGHRWEHAPTCVGFTFWERAVMTKHIQRTEPITAILSRVALELTDLAKCVDRLHGMVENVRRDCIVEIGPFLQSAQNIDIVEQRLSCLSHFVSELCELMPSHWEVEGRVAAQNLKLAELARRLSNIENHESTSIGQLSGESEFF
jgi:hypothetical protein